MNVRRWICVLAAAAAGAFFASPSHADDCAPEAPSRHRVALGGGVYAAYLRAGSDGHYTDTWARGAGDLGYAYRPVRGLEVGADVVVFSGAVILPAASVRGYIPLGTNDFLELGLGGHIGMMILPEFGEFGRTWLGLGVWAGPDVRIWMSDALGLQLGGQVFLAGGGTPRDPSNPDDVYVTNAGFAALGASVAIVWRN